MLLDSCRVRVWMFNNGLRWPSQPLENSGCWLCWHPFESVPLSASSTKIDLEGVLDLQLALHDMKMHLFKGGSQDLATVVLTYEGWSTLCQSSAAKDPSSFTLLPAESPVCGVKTVISHQGFKLVPYSTLQGTCNCVPIIRSLGDFVLGCSQPASIFTIENTSSSIKNEDSCLCFIPT